MSRTAYPPRQDQILLGILYMVASTILFAGVNALVKWEVAIYPVGEVAFFRSFFALIPCYLIILPRTGLAVLRTERRSDHLKRALSQFCSMMSIFLAFQLMPLAGVIAISFSAPLFTTLLSIVVLGAGVVLLLEALGLEVGQAPAFVSRRFQQLWLGFVAATFALILYGTFATAAGPHSGGDHVKRFGTFTTSLHVHAYVVAAFTLTGACAFAWLGVRSHWFTPRLLRVSRRAGRRPRHGRTAVGGLALASASIPTSSACPTSTPWSASSSSQSKMTRTSRNWRPSCPRRASGASGS